MPNIYVGNLDFATSEDELRTLFAGYGAVKTVTALTDRDTGQPLGFAFVEMTTAGEARDAIRALWDGSFQYASQTHSPPMMCTSVSRTERKLPLRSHVNCSALSAETACKILLFAQRSYS